MMNSSRHRSFVRLTAVLLFSLLNAVAQAANYTIDTGKTAASFEARFLGMLPVHGDFRRTTGVLVYDHETRQGSIEVRIDTTTIEAALPRVKVLARGPEFFNVEKFPSIDFHSSRFVFDNARLKSVEGTLTVLGLAQPVTLIVSDSHCEAASADEVAHCHAAAELVIRRSTFGMNSWANSLSDDVTIRVAIMAHETSAAAAAIPAGEAAKP
jgi:polyisoprenoid-binding protein YceI